MLERHGIRIGPETIGLVTYLNDGKRPEGQEGNFMIVEVLGPCEIATTIMVLEEYNAELHSNVPPRTS